MKSAEAAMSSALTGLAVCVMLFVCNDAFAQLTMVTGRVIDARTASPLPAAQVSAEGAVGVETDASGEFRIALPAGTHTLVVSLVGFSVARQQIEVGQAPAPPMTIALFEGTGVHERVSVSSAALPQQDGPVGETLHGREIQALRGVTLDDPLRAVQSLPSVAATDDFYSEFAVRGSPFRHVGLVVDGMPTRYLMHAVYGTTDGGSIAAINSDALSALSLQPGSYAQQTGRSLGALLDLTLREGDRERTRGRVGLSGTSATVLFEGPIGDGRGSWLATARRSYLDLLIARIVPDENVAFGFSDVGTKLVFDVTPRHQLQVTAIGGASGFDENPADLGIDDEAEIRGRSWLAALSWRYTPSARLTVIERVYSTGLVYKVENPNLDALDDSRSRELGWRIDGSIDAGRGVLLQIGGDVQRSSIRRALSRSLNAAPVLTRLTEHHESGIAASAYGQARWSVPRLTLTPGVRIDRWGPTNATRLSPWVTTNVALARGTSLVGGGGVYRQFADLEQIFGVQGGGAGLRPETALHVDLGVSQRLRRDITIRASTYRRDERDVLWTPAGEPRRLAGGGLYLGRFDAPWINTLDGRARGIEVVIRRDAPVGLSGWVGYAYGRHRYTDVRTGDTFWADFDQRHGLSFFGHYPLSGRTSIGMKLRYGSNYPLRGYIVESDPFRPGQPTVPAATLTTFPRYVLTTRRNEARLPAYARLDVRIDRTFTWWGRRATVFAEVANVLNRDNLANVPYEFDRAGRVFDPTRSLFPIVPSAGFVIEL